MLVIIRIGGTPASEGRNDTGSNRKRAAASDLGASFLPWRCRLLTTRRRLSHFAAAMFGWAAAARQVARRVDQRDVRQSLRKVAKLTAGARIVFFGQQPDIVAPRQQTFEQRLGVRVAPLQCQIVGEP